MWKNNTPDKIFLNDRSISDAHVVIPMRSLKLIQLWNQTGMNFQSFLDIFQNAFK